MLGELILPFHHVDSHYFNLINAKCLQELSKVIHDLNPLRWSLACESSACRERGYGP